MIRLFFFKKRKRKKLTGKVIEKLARELRQVSQYSQMGYNGSNNLSS